MKYDDLEHTQDLFDLESDIPSPIESIDMEGASKETLAEEVKEEQMPIEENNSLNDKKKKKSFKEKWHDLSKKKKVIIIVSMVLVLIAIILLIVFLVLKFNKKPEVVEKPKEKEVIVEKDNYTYRNGELVFFDNDKELGTYTCENKEENLCYVAYYSLEDDFDVDKNVNEKEELLVQRSIIYENNYVFIYDNKKEENGSIILYNIITGQTEGTYNLVKGFKDSNYVIVSDTNDKYGALEISKDKVTEKISFSFEYLGRMSKDSNIVAKTNNKYYIYDPNGKALSKGSSSEIKSYNKAYLVVSDEGAYQAYDFKGNLVFSDTYDYIKLYDNFAVLIKDKELFIRDYKDNKYMEDGIELGNTNYNALNIYDENNKLVETKQAYTLSVNGDEIDIVYTVKNKEKSKTINMGEASINATTKYMSYFDGKLYFYKNEDKTDILGTYTCTNKNTNVLNNCVIATDSFYSKNNKETDYSASVGWIPIFNNRYVFIYDSIDTNNPTIILYDLKNSKTLSKYASVDTGSYTNIKEVSFKTTGGTYVMAQNKSGKYGIIRVGEEVNSAVGFNYTSMEKFKDYYKAKDDTNNTVLINENGTVATSKIGYDIVDYSGTILKAQNNNKYLVFGFDGTKYGSEYDYVKLENDYFVSINNKELDIHKYSDAEFGLGQNVVIDTTNYEGSFIVTLNNNTFNVQVVASGVTYAFDATTGELVEAEG